MKEWLLKNIKLEQIIIFVLTFLLILYGFFDFITSNQTYHNIGGVLFLTDRTVSKVFLILIVVYLFVVDIFLLSKKQNFFKIINDKKLLLLIISFTILVLLCPFSYLVGVTKLSSMVDGTLYVFLAYLLFVFSYLYIQTFNGINKTFKYSILALFLFYLFFNLFYFFYISLRPMSSGNTRIPSLAHLFFPSGLMPCILLIFNKEKFITFLLISFYFLLVASSQKASILLIFCLSFAVYLFFFVKNNKRIIAFKSVLIIIAIIVLIIANITEGNILSDNLSFVAIFNGSNRFESWSSLVAELKNYSFKELIFGRGYGTTSLITPGGFAAHNDYLEYIIDYGLIGLASFLFFQITLIANLLKTKFLGNAFSIIYIIIFIIITSLTSAMFINMNMYMYFSIGIILTLNTKQGIGDFDAI